MKPEIKQKWIEALESGKYKKGVEKLRIEEEGKLSYCCLGVLCDLHLEETGEGKWEKDGTYRATIEGVVSSSQTVLPSKVREWAGMRDTTGLFSVKEEDTELLNSIFRYESFPGTESGLTSVNDASKKKDFSDVLPFIKKHF